MRGNRSFRVLMVDDDEDDYILTRGVLDEVEGSDYELDWVSNLDTGFASLRPDAYDIILMDYYFGGRTGVEILREAMDLGCTTPIILLTGLGDREVDYAAMQAGAADYLEKDNLTPQLLERSIRYAVSAAQARKALLEKSVLLRTTLDNTGTGIAAFDQRGRLVAWNRRFLEMLGLEKGFEHLDGFESRAAPETDLLSKRVAERLKLGRRLVGDRTEHIGPDGRVLEVLNNRTRDGGNVIICVDVTERKSFETTLIESKSAAELANRTKTEFLANVSHELRTPLNAIIGFSELLQLQMSGPLGDPKYLGYARDIQRGGQHLLSLINDVLDVSTIESGNYDVHEEAVETNVVVESCLRMIDERVAAAHLTINCEIDPDMSYLSVDRRAIKQIILNLLSNAVKFTPKHGKVWLRVDKTGGQGVRISVVDTGVGIAPEDIGRVLEPFGQVRDMTGDRVDGTGLGLPLVKSLTELLGGNLELLSTPGEGTTVNIYLPRGRIFDQQTAEQGKQGLATR
ncbi:MAG: PAS-domain containing protein [Rhodospirillales bacterium]|nr:MAG: PAS-domain containing protein [Rhodospirillales bacterium]